LAVLLTHLKTVSVVLEPKTNVNLDC